MRKKIVSLILALALVSLPILLYGAAATISSSDRISLGNFAAVTGIVTVNSGDTIATGLSSVIFFSAIVNSVVGVGSNVTTEPVSYTVSAGTITVYTDTNGLRYRFFAIGGP